MSLERRMRERRLQDQELERYLGLHKIDVTSDRISQRRYSPADIEALEEERLPWLKALRRRRAV